MFFLLQNLKFVLWIWIPRQHWVICWSGTLAKGNQPLSATMSQDDLKSVDSACAGSGYYFQSCKPLYRFSVTALPFYSLNDSVSDYWAISIFTPPFAPPSSSSPPPSSSSSSPYSSSLLPTPSSPPPSSSPKSPLQAMIYNIHLLKQPAAPTEREERCDYRLLHPVRPARQRDPLQEDDSGHWEPAGWHRLSQHFSRHISRHLSHHLSQHLSQHLPHNLSQTIISGLAPFSKYSVTVSPFTSVGPGPTSSKSVVATLEGGENVEVKVDCSSLKNRFEKY